MAYTSLKEAIAGYVKENHLQEITGEGLQEILLNMVDSLGADYQMAGVATPETNPGTPDQKVVYIAGPGTYPNFGPATIDYGKIGILSYDGSWSLSTITINDSLPAYININELANHPAAYANAATALGDVPVLYRRKGVKVVYLDNVQQLWIEMICQDDAGVNWWTDVENNWVIEGPIETRIATATGGQQLRIAGEKRGNLDDVLNVNVWNEQITAYNSAASARAAVPANKRKLGGIIIYLVSTGTDTSGWMIDEFIGSSISDWTVADNWKTIGPISVTQNTSTGHTDITIGSETTPVASVDDLNRTANDVCIKATLAFEFSEADNYFRVKVSGDKTLMARGKYIAFATFSEPINISLEGYYIIYVDLADGNKIKVVAFNSFSQVNTNIVVAQFYFDSITNFKSSYILYSAFSNTEINGSSRYCDTLLIDRTANDVSLIGKLVIDSSQTDGLHIQIASSDVGHLPCLFSRGKYICFPVNQDNLLTSENYYIIYVDLADGNKIKVVAFNSFSQVNTNVIVAVLHYLGLNTVISPSLIGYSAFSLIEIDGKILQYQRSLLKYAEIGDSITYLADNKWETSYDDTGTQQTGYKGYGYGRYLAEAMGISYANHYPQGANGRTFSEYVKDWIVDNKWSFPNNIDIWTIFLGTNDWGKSMNELVFKQELGTIDDYKNDTWTESNATTYGAMRKLVNKIRSLCTNQKVPKIIFISPMQRGAFLYGNEESFAENTFCPSAIKRNANGVYEYVLNRTGAKRTVAFTLLDVVNAIKEVCEYESFEFVDWFNDSIFDKSFLNMAQTFANAGWSQNTPFGTVSIDGMRDNLHPAVNGRIYKIMGKRLIGKIGNDFYDK